MARRTAGAPGRLWASVAILLTLALPGCPDRGGTPRVSPSLSGGPGSTAPAGEVPDLDHVVLIVMENREYDQVIGGPEAPFINTMAQTSALATSFYAIRHPSLPNYLSLLSGSTHGVSSDCADCRQSGPTLVDQLESAGRTWKAYMESMPSPCFTEASADPYAKKHNPFMYFDSIAGDPERCAKVVPLTELSADLSSNGLADFTWISPNLCNDGHNCPLSVADGFLRDLLPTLLPALGPRGVVILTWDEGTTDRGCCQKAAGGHIVTVVAGPGARPATRSGRPFDTYSILRTIEDSWGLSHLGDAGCSCTEPLTPLLRTG